MSIDAGLNPKLTGCMASVNQHTGITAILQLPNETFESKTMRRAF